MNNYQSTNDFSNQKINKNQKGNKIEYKIISFLNIITNKEFNYKNPFDTYISSFDKSKDFNDKAFYNEYFGFNNENMDYEEKKLIISWFKTYKNSRQLKKQLSNGFLIYYEKGKLYINDQFNNTIGEPIPTGDICCICELKTGKILVINDNMVLYKISINGGGKYEIRNLKNIIKINLLFELDENKYIISCSEGIFYFEGEILNITKEDLNANNLISNEYYIEGSIIDKKILVLINNNNNGSNLHIYDLRKKKKIYEINNWSPFINNSLSVIQLNKNTNIILMGYKKPSSNEILAIQIKKEDNNNISINHKYHGIKSGYDFICPLKDFKAQNNILINDIKINDTKYFLIAGNFNIRIFMLEEVETKNYNSINIEFICDIYNTERYINNIKFIIQSYINGNLIIVSNDGKIEEFYIEEG